MYRNKNVDYNHELVLQKCYECASCVWMCVTALERKTKKKEENMNFYEV